MNSQHAYRLLVVDDNPAIHDDFAKILQRLRALGNSAEAEIFGDGGTRADSPQFDLDSAHQGQEALARVKQALEEGRPYATAFVDVRMPPGWDGIETIGHLWRVQPDLQVVICTAYPDYSWDDIRRRLGQSDSLLILKKPFDHIEVLQLVHALTGKWTRAHQARLHLQDLEAEIRARTVELERHQSKDVLHQAQKMETMGQLVSGVAHDFNNLLTIIQGHASLRLDRPPTEAKVADSLEEISRAAEQAETLTRQLLAFGRKEELHPRRLSSSPPSVKPAAVVENVKRPESDETVLVVEDDPTLRDLVRVMLESQGYRVLEAQDGATGLQVWRENQGRVDLLLSDMVMPGGMSGLELAEELREYAPALKVLFSSGYSQELFSGGLQSVPGAGFLAKPYRPRELVKTVRDCLEGTVLASEMQP